MKKVLIFVGAIVGIELIGSLSGILSMSGPRGWYQLLEKPAFNPPAWVFGPAWTFLFFLMAISLSLVLISRKKWSIKKPALIAFAIQLVLNFSWSFFFFYWHSLAGALIEIVLLLVAIVFTIYYSAKVSKTSAYLLIPYLYWVSFATILSYNIWRLNG